MKRIALLAAAALASGCVSSEPLPPPITGWACPESLVDYVVVTFPNGTLVDPGMPTIPCVYNNVQGATFLSFAGGTYNFVVTGFENVQGFGAVETYSSQVTVSVPFPGSDVILYWDFVRYDYTGAVAATYDPMPECTYVACQTVHAAGIPDDLDIYANFVTPNGSATIGTYCTAPGVAVDTITYNLVDHAGTSVASGEMACGSALVPAGISFGTNIDRDVYSLRAQGLVGGPTGTVVFDTATRANVPLYPNCTPQTLAHFAADIGNFAWDARLYDVSGNATFCP
jgi:hypothetical protein